MSCWLLGHHGTERPMAGGGWERTGGFSTCLSEVACPAEVWGCVAHYEDPLGLALGHVQSIRKSLSMSGDPQAS